MMPLRDYRLWRVLAFTAFLHWLPTTTIASKQQVGSPRRLAQNRQQPPNFVNDVYHCSNPQMVNNIEPDVVCDPTTFLWNLTALDPTAPPRLCNGVNYTQIYEASFTQVGLSDIYKPCYWWNLMYGSMAPSATPSTSFPSVTPTSSPSTIPSFLPTFAPTTLTPSATPTSPPSLIPSDFPTAVPSLTPTSLPTLVPSSVPSTLTPSALPTATAIAATTAPHLLPTSAPIRRSAPHTSKPTRAPNSLRPTTFVTTLSPTQTFSPTQFISTLNPTFGSTVDHTDALVRPLANFVVAYTISPTPVTANGFLRRLDRKRRLLSVNRYQLTALTATYLIEQLKADFPNSHVKTVALVLTSVSAEVSVDHNTTTNTSISSSTFEEALSGEVVFGTTETSVVPLLSDLYASIQSAFTESQSLKMYFKLLQASKDPVLKRISQIDLIQGATAINATTTDSTSNSTSSLNSPNNTKQGVKWTVGLIAVVAGGGLATFGVALLVYLCITHKSRKRRRRFRKQQREQKETDAKKTKNAEADSSIRGTGRIPPPPPPLDTFNSDTKSVVPINRNRRWLSWGGDHSLPDLALQATESVNSSPLSMMTTPRSKSDSPLKVAAPTSAAVGMFGAQSKLRAVNDVDELVSDDGHDECIRSAADDDRSEVTSTYSYIETNTNDEHSISVAPSFLYGANETGSIMGDCDDFGELVGAATNRVHRTPWIDDLSLPVKPTTWGLTTANNKKIPKPPPPPPLNAPPILSVANAENRPLPATKASVDPDDSHLLNISGSYGSFYEYDEKKGIMIISRPSAVEDPINMDGEMPSKIGGSFLLEESFVSQEESQSDAVIVAGNQGEISVLDSPGRLPGMDSGSMFLNSPSTSLSTNSPRKGPMSGRTQQSLPADDNGIGDVLQFYEGTTNATSISSTPSPVKTKKFAFDEVWRDIVEEDMDDHVRDTTSTASTAKTQLRSPASQRNEETQASDVSVNVPQRLNCSDTSIRSTSGSSYSNRAASRDASGDFPLQNIDSSLKSFNRNDSPLMRSLTHNGSQTSHSFSNLDSPSRLGRSEQPSFRKNSSKSAGASDVYEGDDEDHEVSFATMTSGMHAVQSTSPVTNHAAADPRNQEIATRRWLANQANDPKSDFKQLRSKSVAPTSAGQRRRGTAAASGVSGAKRGSSLPPSRIAALHRVREEMAFDEEATPRVQQIEEASDEGATKFSI